MPKITFPVFVTVVQPYHVYVDADENASEEEIKRLVKEKILKEQYDALCEDNDIEIESDDIDIIMIDYEGERHEDEEEG